LFSLDIADSLLCIVVLIRERGNDVLSFTHHLTYSLPVIEMAHFSNVIINDGSFKFNSAQGDLHIHNRDSESGMHNLSLV
jgi:hypothetical protein